MLLQAQSISKSYAGVVALDGVNFELAEGEVHALIGENGAGKSTLIKIISGAVQADAGALKIDGVIITHNTPLHARSLGVSVIYQQPTLFPHLSVAENIALTLEKGSQWGTIRWADRHKTAADLLQRVGASIDPGRFVSTLSMPEQQLVEIAKAIGAAARIFIMDEPTASLTGREVENLFQVIRDLRARGAGVIYISHRLEEITAIADRVTVLRDGRTIATRPASQLERSTLIDMMVGREVSSVFPKRTVPIGEVALELRQLTNHEAGIRNVSLKAHRGEILGIAGLVGSGRTQLAETIFGVTPADSGEILLGGNAITIGSPSDAIRHRIAYVPEDRRQHGIVLDMPIAANVGLATLPVTARAGMVNRQVERATAQAYVDRLGIKCNSIEDPAATLSGGNQQKVALARWLATEPDVLILDEPTQGVDVGAKAEIHRFMGDCVERGMAVIMISSEMPEILALSDRIAVMRAGALAGTLHRNEATPQAILDLSLGKSGPEAAEVA